MSAANLLSARSLPDTDFRDPGQVLTRLNDVFQMEKQDGKYFTIWYGVYRTRRTDAWPTATPATRRAARSPARPAESARLQQLDSTDPAIGMLPPGMPFHTETVSLEHIARLLVYSDGDLRDRPAWQAMWQLGEFVAFLSGPRQGKAWPTACFRTSGKSMGPTPWPTISRCSRCDSRGSPAAERNSLRSGDPSAVYPVG